MLFTVQHFARRAFRNFFSSCILQYENAVLISQCFPCLCCSTDDQPEFSRAGSCESYVHKNVIPTRAGEIRRPVCSGQPSISSNHAVQRPELYHLIGKLRVMQIIAYIVQLNSVHENRPIRTAQELDVTAATAIQLAETDRIPAILQFRKIDTITCAIDFHCEIMAHLRHIRAGRLAQQNTVAASCFRICRSVQHCTNVASLASPNVSVRCICTSYFCPCLVTTRGKAFCRYRCAKRHDADRISHDCGIRLYAFKPQRYRNRSACEKRASSNRAPLTAHALCALIQRHLLRHATSCNGVWGCFADRRIIFPLCVPNRNFITTRSKVVRSPSCGSLFDSVSVRFGEIVRAIVICTTRAFIPCSCCREA